MDDCGKDFSVFHSYIPLPAFRIMFGKLDLKRDLKSCVSLLATYVLISA
jgi:hypothetical protein